MKNKSNLKRAQLAQHKAAVIDSNAKDPLVDLFRSARVDAARSIDNVADDAGVTAATVRMLETAPQKVPLHDVYAVANALNLDPGLVLGLLHSALR